MSMLNNIANGRNACLTQYVVLYHFPVVPLNRIGLMVVCRRIAQYHEQGCQSVLYSLMVAHRSSCHSLLKSFFFVWSCGCSLLCACSIYCLNVGIKHGLSCINIRQVPRGVLKIEAGGLGLGFQHLTQDLANVKSLKNHVCSLLLHKN